MRASVDTGVFVALFAGDEEATPWAQRVLEEVAVRYDMTLNSEDNADTGGGGQQPDTEEKKNTHNDRHAI